MQSVRSHVALLDAMKRDEKPSYKQKHTIRHGSHAGMCTEETSIAEPCVHDSKLE